ncbi:MAG: D-2-hydroxyacid dehydrogenase, partial [Chloroflexota bacterium]
MPKVMIFSPEVDEYRQRIESAHLRGLELTTDSNVCDIALGEPKPIRDVLAHLPRLKWVQSVYAGVEPLVDPTQRRDYILTNARDVFGTFMSEYVFGYILFHEKKILERMRAQQARQWQPAESGILPGKTIGLLGVGSIGAHLASTAKHFRMTVRGYTRESEASTQVDKYYHGEDLLEFAEGLDYLVSVLPRTRDTNRIVNVEVLNALQPHALFINVGRGNAVDGSALIEALKTGRLAAAVLDVFDKEPLPED